MKKEELKKSYNEIKISPAEKAKIYNNIMERKNKKKNVWMPLVGFGAVALASFGAFMFINNGGLNGNKSLEDNKDKIVEKQNIALLGDLSLESKYRKEIMVNSRSYLTANKIDISELKDGETKEFDANEIVDNDDYNSCKGKLTISRYNGDYTYATNVTCSANTEGKDVEFKIYDGFLSDVYEVNEGIITVSFSNMKHQYENLVSNDVVLTLFNDNGEMVWNTEFKNSDTTYFNNENIIKRVYSIHNFGENYLVQFEYILDGQFTESGSGIGTAGCDLVLFDKNGKILKQYSLEYEEPGKMLEVYSLGEFIGEDNGKAYYEVDVRNPEDDNLGYIMEVSDSIRLIRYDEVLDADDDEGVQNTRVINTVKNGYFYGYVKRKSFDENMELEQNVVFKMDMNGDIFFEKELKGLSEDSLILETFVDDSENIYFTISSENIDGSDLVVKYDKNLNYITTYDVKNYIETDETILLNDVSLVDDKLLLDIRNIDWSMQYVITLDEDGNVIKEYSVDTKDVNSNFEYSYLYKNLIVKDKLTQVYSVSDSLTNSILLVFYK